MFLYDTPPCKECGERNPHCHSVCEKYKKWKIEHENRKAEVVQKQNVQNQLTAARIEFSNNYLKKTKRKRKKY